MSRIPTLSNKLSPWPRIHIGEIPPNNTAIEHSTGSAGHRLNYGQRFRSIENFAQPRGRASSDAGRGMTKPQVRGRSTSFGSTQEFKSTYGSVPVQRLDRKVSDRKVQELLALRKRRLREAECRGDEVEVFRLKNLNLFDEVESPKINEDEPKEVEFIGDFAGQTYHQDLASQIDVFDFGFTHRSRSAIRPNSVSQGHTATLCWQMKLEYTQGLAVPDEFSQCTIHPSPNPCASSPGFAPQPASPKSLSYGSRHSLRHPNDSSIGSSTLKDSSESSSPATSSSTAIASEPPSPTEHSSIVPNPNADDPFLCIAKYIGRRVQGDSQCRKTRTSKFHASKTDAKRTPHTQCTCTNHDCRAYLSGPPSKHCRLCKLPRLQPEIATAVDRIEEMKTSALSQANANMPAEEKCEAGEYATFEALQEDMKLVEIYNAETEKRCRNGVWWEGWLIVQDLQSKGIVGSKPYVYARDD